MCNRSIVSLAALSIPAGGLATRVTKLLCFISCLLLGLAGRAGAQVTLFDTAATTGNGVFDDSAAGGYAESLPAAPVPPNSGLTGHTMNYANYVNYTSALPHVDAAQLKMDITQTFNSVPFFGVTGKLQQATSVTGDTAMLSYQFQSSFEGFMLGANPASAVTALGITVSGNVGTNLGAFTDFTMQQDYYDAAAPYLHIGYLRWTDHNTTVGAFSYTVYPTWNPIGATVLTNNLINVQGYLSVQADPSSISFGPAVPEPGSAACLALAGAASLAGRRRRA